MAIRHDEARKRVDGVVKRSGTARSEAQGARWRVPIGRHRAQIATRLDAHGVPGETALWRGVLLNCERTGG